MISENLLGKFIQFKDGYTIKIDQDILNGLYYNEHHKQCFIEDKFGMVKEWVNIVESDSGKHYRDDLFSPLCNLVLD